MNSVRFRSVVQFLNADLPSLADWEFQNCLRSLRQKNRSPGLSQQILTQQMWGEVQESVFLKRFPVFLVQSQTAGVGTIEFPNIQMVVVGELTRQRYKIMKFQHLEDFQHQLETPPFISSQRDQSPNVTVMATALLSGIFITQTSLPYSLVNLSKQVFK